ncbi:MAG: type VII toxin-antitoxin system MntA family adenylyltransferase antitoxin [Gammaproteobacteria bacterium]
MESNKIKAALHLLLERLPGLEAAYLYGSTARNEAHAASDLDIAVLAERALDPIGLFDLAGELASLLGREVDLVDLSRTSTVFRSQVVSRGHRFYCRNETACEAFEDRVFASYAYLNEARRGILDDIRRRGRIHG